MNVRGRLLLLILGFLKVFDAWLDKQCDFILTI